METNMEGTSLEIMGLSVEVAGKFHFGHFLTFLSFLLGHS